MSDFIITYDWLKLKTFDFYSISRRQAELMGIKYPLEHGWIEEVIGRHISVENAKEISMLANMQYMKRKKKAEKRNSLTQKLFQKQRQEFLQSKLFENDTATINPVSKITFDDMKKVQ